MKGLDIKHQSLRKMSTKELWKRADALYKAEKIYGATAIGLTLVTPFTAGISTAGAVPLIRKIYNIPQEADKIYDEIEKREK